MAHPALNFAYLWRTDVLSDVLLHVYPHDNLGTDVKSQDAALSLPLHASLLFTSSARFFRAELGKYWTGKNKVKLAAHLLEGEPVGGCEAVLKHLYTGQLPSDSKTLAWMVQRADIFDLQATVDACLEALSHLARRQAVSLQDVGLLQRWSLNIYHDCEADKMTQRTQLVARIAEQTLAAQLGNARLVVTTPHLLEQFVQLPLLLLQRWAAMENLEVDSDNTLMVLLTTWHDHSSSTHPDKLRPGTEGQQGVDREVLCDALSALVNLQHVTQAFHLQAVPHLRWYRPPSGLPQQHAVARVLSQLHSASLPPLIPNLRPADTAHGPVWPRRPEDNRPSKQWTLNMEQVNTLWSQGELELPGEVYTAGWTFHFGLMTGPSAAGAGGQCTLGVFVWPVWPQPLATHGLAGKVSSPVVVLHMEVQVGDGPLVTGLLMTDKDRPQAWSDVLQTSFLTPQELMSHISHCDVHVRVSILSTC